MRVFSVWVPRGASQLDEVLRRHPKANGLFDEVISQNARRRRIAVRWAEPGRTFWGSLIFQRHKAKSTGTNRNPRNSLSGWQRSRAARDGQPSSSQDFQTP